ncbi:hypothetical protein MUP32_06935 [Candidatus Microgenomates bacterium]|nr:hypothetical protein [Candidatus Microgenomates bacterium]
MIILIHGDDTVTSRNKLKEENDKVPESEIVHFEGSKLQLSDLVNSLEASSLFAEKKLVIVENFLSGGMNKSKQQIFEYLSGQIFLHDLIFWEGKRIEKATIKKYFSKAKEISCLLPSLLFKFLDLLGIERPESLLLLFHNLLKQTEAELVYAMILRQWRNLIVVKDNPTLLPGFAPWQIGKLKSQSRGLSLEEYILSYRKLLAIDYQIKSGQTPYRLEQLLDIFLANL